MKGASPTDIVGRTFDRLTVVALATRNPVRWQCQCSCGGSVIARTANLTTGNTRSCGCARVRRDITGQRFGRLLVMRRAAEKSANAQPRVNWQCVCDCGTQCVKNAWQMQRGRTRSCGCLAREVSRANMLACRARRVP